MTTNQTPLVDILRLHAEDLHSDYGHNKSARLLSQAADEIERLRSNALALEDEKNDYMDGVGDVLGQDHDGETLWAAAQRVMSECDRLRAELAKADGQINRCVEQNKYLESTISRLREYIRHKPLCIRNSTLWQINNHRCDCGYDDLIKEIGE